MKIFMSALLLSILGCSQSSVLTIKGRLTVAGYAPHSYLTIKDATTHRTYKIKNASSFDLMHKQKKVITIKGKLQQNAIGPGFPAVVEVLKVYDTNTTN